MRECNACGGDFKWGRLPSGRFVPLDPIPSPIGELVLMRDGVSVYPLALQPVYQKMDDEATQSRRYRNHHQTCPLGYWWLSFAHLSGKLKVGLDQWYGRERELYEATARLDGVAGADRKRRANNSTPDGPRSFFD